MLYLLYFLFFSQVSSSGDLEGCTIDFLSGIGGPQISIFGSLSTPLIAVDEDENAPIITYQDHRVLIGNRKWIQEKNFIDIPPAVEEKMASQERLGHTALLAAVDGNFVF